MSEEEIITVILKLSFGFFSAFTAVLLWSKTRDEAWLMMVLGIIVMYAGTVFSVLDSFGISHYDIIMYKGYSVLRLGFMILPFFFFTLGFLIFLYRIRKI